jgi:SAM-dependent methyltransferase
MIVSPGASEAVVSPSPARVREAIAPYLGGLLPLATPEGRRMWSARRRQTLRASVRLILRQLLRGARERSSSATERSYTDSYQTTTVDSFDASLRPPGRFNPFKLEGEIVLLPPIGLFAAYLTVLTDLLGALRPSSVCEVGFGSGKNLIYLAPRLPQVNFSGYELTASGLALAQHLQACGTLPVNLAGLVGPLDEGGRRAVDRIAFHQGNARTLPAADKSVDVTFTMLALEQMWPILPDVLSEIRRVTRRHVVFLEAFRDANDVIGYLNLLSRNYFRASVRQIEAAGFRRRELIEYLPNKATFATALLVADVSTP